MLEIILGLILIYILLPNGDNDSDKDFDQIKNRVLTDLNNKRTKK